MPLFVKRNNKIVLQRCIEGWVRDYHVHLCKHTHCCHVHFYLKTLHLVFQLPRIYISIAYEGCNWETKIQRSQKERENKWIFHLLLLTLSACVLTWSLMFKVPFRIPVCHMSPGNDPWNFSLGSFQACAMPMPLLDQWSLQKFNLLFDCWQLHGLWTVCSEGRKQPVI